MSNKLNGNSYELAESMYKLCKEIKKQGRSTMRNGEPLAKFFERNFGVTPREFEQIEKPRRDISTLGRKSRFK